MALEVHFNSITPAISSETHSGGWSGGTGAVDRYTRIGTSIPPGNEQYEGYGVSSGGNWTSGRSGLAADTTYYLEALAVDSAYSVSSGYYSFKTLASAATVPAPSSSAVTSTTATITTNTFTPAVNQSTWVMTLYYKKTTDPSYTTAGSSASSNPLSANLTGLTPNTQYQFYSELVRTTVDGITTTSSVENFTTLAGEPEVTTNAASSAANSSATLNATADVNEGTDMTVYWKWGTDNPPTQNTTAAQAVTIDGSVNVEISSLSPSTTYYFQAFITFATPSGTPNEGSVLNFTTAADPALEAAAEDHVITPTFLGKYGVAKTLTYTLRSPAATSSDLLYTSTAPVQADVLIFKDGVYDNTSDNAPAQVSTYLYTLELSATEMTAEVIDVIIHDASGSAFRDQHIRVQTVIELSEVDIDAATGSKANTTALKLTGYGSGHGLSAVAGATGLDIDGVFGQHVMRYNTAGGGGGSTITLDSSASATNDYYNGALVMVISGTGAGQARTITDYVGSSKVATVHKAWATNPDNTSVFVILPGDDPWEVSPGAELAALPTYASSYAKMLQFLFQRFVYKRTQTATAFEMFKDDGSTSFATGGVSDNGTTQTHNELA